MHDLVKQLVAEMDAATAAQGSRNTLVLLGDRDSKYLAAVEKRAKKLGLYVTRPDTDYEFVAAGEPVYVYDTECKDEEMKDYALSALSAGYDIDCVCKEGMSC